METIATPFMWAVFTVFVLAALAVDLLVMRNSGPHRVTSREALLWSLAWIALALAFNAGLWFHLRGAMPADATRIALEFFTGYLVEKALAVDKKVPKIIVTISGDNPPADARITVDGAPVPTGRPVEQDPGDVLEGQAPIDAALAELKRMTSVAVTNRRG